LVTAPGGRVVLSHHLVAGTLVRAAIHRLFRWREPRCVLWL